jgi:hypothetical protein
MPLNRALKNVETYFAHCTLDYFSPHTAIVVMADRITNAGARTPLPFHWYVFFGIVEPISVLAGCVYAIVFQENYYGELVPLGYLRKASALSATTATKGKSSWKLGAQAAKGAASAASALIKLTTPDVPTQMALAQLGSCYFLIMLNSALMFYAIRRWFSQSPAAQERVLYCLFFVLGAADWTHILLTIHFLPAIAAPAAYDPLGLVPFVRKIVLLSTDFSVWNSLLFGNIVITLLLFLARAAWWAGIGRDRFYNGEVPAIPSKKGT